MCLVAKICIYISRYSNLNTMDTLISFTEGPFKYPRKVWFVYRNHPVRPSVSAIVSGPYLSYIEIFEVPTLHKDSQRQCDNFDRRSLGKFRVTGSKRA